MTVEEAIQVVKEISYKPNWVFRAYGEEEGLRVSIVHLEDPSGEWKSLIRFWEDWWREIAGESPLPPPFMPRRMKINSHVWVSSWTLKNMDRRIFLSYFYSKIRDSEEHEIQEWLRYRGDFVKEPRHENN